MTGGPGAVPDALDVLDRLGMLPPAEVAKYLADYPCGYETIQVPRAPMEERCAFVLRTLNP